MTLSYKTRKTWRWTVIGEEDTKGRGRDRLYSREEAKLRWSTERRKLPVWLPGFPARLEERTEQLHSNARQLEASFALKGMGIWRTFEICSKSRVQEWWWDHFIYWWNTYACRSRWWRRNGCSQYIETTLARGWGPVMVQPPKWRHQKFFERIKPSKAVLEGCDWWWCGDAVSTMRGVKVDMKHTIVFKRWGNYRSGWVISTVTLPIGFATDKAIDLIDESATKLRL